MRALDYFTLAFGSIIGVGWIVVMDDWLKRGGPLGAMLGFLIGGLALVPVALVYGRLARQMPESASEIAYTGAVFPRGVSFATGWAMTFTYVIVCPFEAVAIGQLAGHLVPALSSNPLYEVAGHAVFLPHLILAIATIIGITALNYHGVQFSATFQNVMTFGLLAVFAVFASLGLLHGRPDNLPPLFADERGSVGAICSTLLVLQFVPYYLVGFETIPKCAEEAAGDLDHRRFGQVMLLALVSATVFYVTVIGVVAMLHPWPVLIQLESTRDGFATVVAFQRAFGWPWLVQLILLGGVLSLLKVFNGNFLAATRLLYAMGRRDLLGAGLGGIHERFRTPTVAIILVGMVTTAGALLGRAVLVPISEVGSLACGLGWLATSLACCWSAAGTPPLGARLIGVAGAVVSGALLAIAASSFGPYHWLVVAAWSALGLVLWFRQPSPGMRSAPASEKEKG